MANSTREPLQERVLAVVEIAGGSDRPPSAEIATVAYRASEGGLVVIVLSGLSRTALDAMLDPVVHQVGSRVRGVLYLDEQDDAGVRKAIERAELIIATSPCFRANLLAFGIEVLEAEEGLGRLRDCNGRPRAATSAPGRS